MIKGSCLCGTVQWRLDPPFGEMSHCHCSMCRKAHGAAFAGGELAFVELAGGFERFFGGRIGLPVALPPALGKLDAGASGEYLERVDERKVVEALQEGASLEQAANCASAANPDFDLTQNLSGLFQSAAVIDIKTTQTEE